MPAAPVKVWSLMLKDSGGGWVMGVFLSRDEALARLREYEATHGGSELGDPLYGVGGDEAMCQVPITNGDEDDCFIISPHVVGECLP